MEIFEREIAKGVNGNTFNVRTPINGSRNVRIDDFKVPTLEAMKNLQKFVVKKVEIIHVSKSHGMIVAKVFYKEEYLTGFL